MHSHPSTPIPIHCHLISSISTSALNQSTHTHTHPPKLSLRSISLTCPPSSNSLLPLPKSYSSEHAQSEITATPPGREDTTQDENDDSEQTRCARSSLLFAHCPQQPPTVPTYSWHTNRQKICTLTHIHTLTHTHAHTHPLNF
jgi:hypothetical protein